MEPAAATFPTALEKHAGRNGKVFRYTALRRAGYAAGPPATATAAATASEIGTALGPKSAVVDEHGVFEATEDALG